MHDAMRCRRATGTVRPVVRAAVLVIGLAVSLAVLPHAEGQGTTDAFVWVRQFGTPSDDSGSAVAVDATGVYVAGRTALGIFPGDSYDAYLRKYDLNGTVLWTRPIATESFDYANAVAADGSGVSIAGHTGGSLQWGVSGGGVDAYVQKYDVNGTLLFTGQFGSPDFDTALAVAADGTGTYVAGRTEGTIPGQTSLGSVDAFVRRYNVDGNVSNVSWTQQFGTSGYDYASGLAVDATGVYVAGTTSGSFPGETLQGSTDAFVRKYDVRGEVLWTRQFGTSTYAAALAVAADATGVYVTGLVGGSFPGEASAGGADTFLRKYDPDGNAVWTRQYGSPGGDAGFGVGVGRSGVYITGQEDGTLPGQTSAGIPDAFLLRYDVNGTLLGVRQFGTSRFDKGDGIAVGVSGVYVAGETSGSFPGATNAGGLDAFLVSLTEPPPPPVPPGLLHDAVLFVAVLAGVGILVATLAVISLRGQRKRGKVQDPPRAPPPVG